MPNWCRYGLKVEGPADELQRFMSGLKLQGKEKSTSILKKYLPMPEALIGTISGCTNAEAESEKNFHAVVETGYKNWYDWAIANWGCKWADEVWIGTQSDEEATFHGETPWAPPLSGYKAVAEQFPALKFSMEYGEPMMGYTGRVSWKQGQIVDHEEWEDFGGLEDEIEGDAADPP